MRSERAAQALWRYRRWLLAAALLTSIAAGSQLASLGVSNSLAVWYPDDDPALESYRAFQERFGNDELVVVAVSAERRMDDEAGRARLAELTDELYYVDGVASVTSIANVPRTLAEARARLISDDGRTAALLVQLADRNVAESRRREILENVRAAVTKANFDARLAGYGVIFDTLNEASTEGAATLLVVAHVAMLGLLLVFFGSIGATLVTVSTVAAATVWTMGLYAACDQAINMVTMALPTLVLVIAVSDCVHVLRAVARQPHDLPQATRVVRGIAAVLAPCALTTVTTAAGFLALTITELPIVRMLGAFGAAGMLAAFVAAFAILPGCLALRAAEPAGGPAWPDSVANRLGGLGQRRPAAVTAAFTVLGIAAIAGLRYLETDTYSIGYLSEHHPARLDSEYVEATVGPYAPIDYLVNAEDVLAPELLDDLQAWQRALVAGGAVNWSWSLVDALGIDRNTRPSSLSLDDVAGRLAHLRVVAPELTDSLLDGRATLRVTFGAPMMSARRVQSLLETIDSHADFSADVSVEAAGYASLYTRIVERIVRAEVAGFAYAVLLIVTAIGIATRSLGRCLLAIVSNALPLALTLGLMGWIGIPLDVATATIATVILGLIVDDTVHILHPGGRHPAAATRAAIRRCGGSLVITSLTLGAGLMLLGLADIRSVAWFGALCSFAMLAALFSDLLLLPALATLVRSRAAFGAGRARTGIGRAPEGS